MLKTSNPEQKGKSMYRILIVEDDMGIAEAIKDKQSYGSSKLSAYKISEMY